MRQGGDQPGGKVKQKKEWPAVDVLEERTQLQARFQPEPLRLGEYFGAESSASPELVTREDEADVGVLRRHARRRAEKDARPLPAGEPADVRHDGRARRALDVLGASDAVQHHLGRSAERSEGAPCRLRDHDHAVRERAYERVEDGPRGPVRDDLVDVP